jgi:hypothetical protein
MTTGEHICLSRLIIPEHSVSWSHFSYGNFHIVVDMAFGLNQFPNHQVFQGKAGYPAVTVDQPGKHRDAPAVTFIVIVR